MSMEIIEADEKDVAFLETLILDRNGRMYPFKAHFYHEHVRPDTLRVWCAKRARYTVITRELLDWLIEQIAGRPAIEIGAGMGDLGSHLAIPMTDSYQQVENLETAAYMKVFRQTPTTPPDDVIKMDAQSAVLKMKPKVVIGSWITQRWLPGDTEGNQYGPREEKIIAHCDTYIHIGNEAVHGRKRILDIPHETYQFPWLISRAKDQTKNVIWVWNK